MSAVKTNEWVEVTQKIGIPPSGSGENLIFEDGIPMETDWHRAAMNLLIEILSYFWRNRQDFYVSGNMFIYFDPNQVKKRNFRGPDFFVVKGVTDKESWREAWIIWEEGGLAPDFIIELTSTSTEADDKGAKKEIYEQILRVSEYLCYNPQTNELVGWRLQAGHYVDIRPNEQGWIWSEELELWVGTWWGEYLGRPNRWLRFFDSAGRLVLAEWEAEAEAHRIEAEARRAAEAEIARLKAKLKELGQSED
jgi:Uma2 family endonuclease